MAKQRTASPSRTMKPVFLIFCEGETEEAYLDYLKQAYRSPIRIVPKIEGDQVKVCKVNVDEQASLALNYQITSIPTLVFMKYGLFQQRMIGLQNKETIMECLNTLLADE